MVSLNRKTFQDMSNLVLFQLLAPGRTEIWFALSSISLLWLWAKGVGPQLVLHTDQNEGDIRPVECIIWRDGCMSKIYRRNFEFRNFRRD